MRIIIIEKLKTRSEQKTIGRLKSPLKLDSSIHKKTKTKQGKNENEGKTKKENMTHLIYQEEERMIEGKKPKKDGSIQQTSKK